MRWGVWCRVSGGVTGTREAWLKSLGVRQEFATKEEAEKEASALNERMNGPYRTASFSYTARPITETGG